MGSIVETTQKILPTALTLLSHQNFPISLLHLPPPPSHKSTTTSNPTKLPPAVLFTPATGVPAKFYLPFASWLNATYGVPSLIVDYRFSGKSWPTGLRMNDRKGKLESLKKEGSSVTYFDWARDEEIALKFMIDEYGKDREVVVVCNSVGGHLLPQCKPSFTDQVARALFLGVFAPYHGMAPPEQEPIKRKYWVELVAKTKELGYFPGRASGFGNDLPQNIGLEWAEMMHHPTYWAHNKDFSNFRTPVLSIHFNDDALCYGLTSQTDRVLEVFPSSPSTRIAYDPLTQGWGPQGHVNVFQPSNENGGGTHEGIWNLLADYIIHNKIREGEDFKHFRGGVTGGKSRL